MATPLNLAPGYGRPDYQHAAELRRQAREREREFWAHLRLALVGLFGAAVLLGGSFLALVVSNQSVSSELRLPARSYPQGAGKGGNYQSPEGADRGAVRIDVTPGAFDERRRRSWREGGWVLFGGVGIVGVLATAYACLERWRKTGLDRIKRLADGMVECLKRVPS